VIIERLLYCRAVAFIFYQTTLIPVASIDDEFESLLRSGSNNKELFFAWDFPLPFTSRISVLYISGFDLEALSFIAAVSSHILCLEMHKAIALTWAAIRATEAIRLGNFLLGL